MKKRSLLFLLALTTGVVMAQEDEPKEGWTKEGNVSLLFNQAAFNAEWQGGGTSNYGGNISLNYDFNYRKGDLTWDNKIIGDFGLTKVKDQEFTRKTNDRLEFTSTLGKQIEESNWYYSFFTNMRTQFAKGYTYGEDADGNTTRTERTHFFSPAYLQFGPGMLWKKNDNFKVNFAPATARFIFVDPSFTSGADYVDGKYFGVDAGKSSRFELGASVNAFAKFTLMENVTLSNTLNLYSNYLEDPQNVDIDYTGNVVMKVNDFISTNFIFQAIYDDNAVGAFQIREVLGAGLTYTF